MVQEGAKGFHFQEGQSNIRAGGLPAEFYLLMLVGGWGADLVQWKSWGKGIREQPLLVNFTGWQIAPNTCACFCVFINEPQGRVCWALWSVCGISVGAHQKCDSSSHPLLHIELAGPEARGWS